MDTKLREAPVHAKPITEYAPETRAARQYRALAREVTACLRPDREESTVAALIPDAADQPSGGDRSDDAQAAPVQKQEITSQVTQKTSAGDG